MNKLIYLLLTILVAISCNIKTKKTQIFNDLFFDNLNGKPVKTEEISYTTDSAGETLTADSCCRDIIEYDSNGYRIRQFSIDMNGNEKYGRIYTRYKSGQVKELSFTQNGKIISTLYSNLDKKGRYVTATDFDSMGKLLSFYTDIAINSYGKIISMKNYNPDSSLLKTVVNTYYKQIWCGGFIKDSVGKTIFSTSISLNEKMDPSTRTEISMANGRADTTHTTFLYTTYDINENWTKRKEMDEKANLRKVVKRLIYYR